MRERSRPAAIVAYLPGESLPVRRQRSVGRSASEARLGLETERDSLSLFSPYDDVAITWRRRRLGTMPSQSAAASAAPRLTVSKVQGLVMNLDRVAEPILATAPLAALLSAGYAH